MLTELDIRHLGVIAHTTVELDEGLTVLTGETGAGKTMILSGLRLLTGGRADAGRVRAGADHAVVEGRFAVPSELGSHAAALVDAAGGSIDENGEYIVSRTVKASGRSKAHLGGRAVPASTLAEFTADLIAIHGQNDQLRLLSPERQLEALDQYGQGCAQQAAAYREAFEKHRQLAKDLAARTAQRRELAQEADRLHFAIEEISAVDPQPGEDEEIQATIRRLQDAESLREATQAAMGRLDGPSAVDAMDSSDMEGAADLIAGAARGLAAAHDPDLRALAERLDDVQVVLSDVSSELGAYLSRLPQDPEELEQLLNRQQQLKTLLRKYAPDIDGVIQWREKAEMKLSRIDVSPGALDDLAAAVAEAESTMLERGKKLSAARRTAAKALSAAVTAELHGLAMPKAVFSVSLETKKPGPHGLDEVEFLLAPAPKIPAKPLATSASGGELSRVMLALEVIVSATQSGTTLVFDEVDAGVGGKAAIEIGRRLARLARHNQVLVVTHLPQVAAFADTHIHISKDVADDSVTSAATSLTAEMRVEELARMLAGLDDTATGRAHAAELLQLAAEDKAS